MKIAKIKVLFLLFVIVCCLQLCACQADHTETIILEQSAKPDETESIPQLLFGKTVSFDEDTGIRRSALDNQGLPLNVYFEIPVFDKESVGYQKINTFFQNLEDDFFSEQNENLLTAWWCAATIPSEAHKSEDFSYENYAIVHTHSEELLSVGIYFYWWMGGVNNTGGSCYTFSPATGELLKLSDLIEETEQEALNALYRVMEAEGLDLTWGNIQERSLDDFDFYFADDKVFIYFDRYEVAAGVGGSITVQLPVSLKNMEGYDTSEEEKLKWLGESRSDGWRCEGACINPDGISCDSFLVRITSPDGSLFQEIALSAESRTMPTGTAHWEDVNFDGELDVLVHLGGGRGGTQGYAAVLWDETIDGYREEPIYGEIGNPTPDSEHKIIWDGADASFQFDLSAWEYWNGELVKTHQLSALYNSSSEDQSVSYIEYEFANGTLSEIQHIAITQNDIQNVDTYIPAFAMWEGWRWCDIQHFRQKG